MGTTEEDLQAALEAERKRTAELAAGLRHANISAALRDLALPTAFADVVPADLEASPEALKDFVARFLPPTAAQPSGEAPPPNLEGWARYERTAELGSSVPAAGKTEVELLIEEGMKGLEALRGGGTDWNHHKPPDEMAQENANFARRVNRLNRSHEMAVRRGEATPGGYFQAWGFGGRHDPPPWAYVAEDGIRE